MLIALGVYGLDSEVLEWGLRRLRTSGASLGSITTS